MPTLEAGRGLDAVIAEKVFGAEVRWDEGYATPQQVQRASMPGDWWGGIPAYSTDIAAAWQVAELFEEMELRHGPSGWLCRLERGDDEHVQFGESLRAETALLAICRAALAAFETPR